MDKNHQKVSGEYPQRKTLWDWAQLLIVPLLLAVLGSGFTLVQYWTSQDIANRNRQQDLQIAKNTQEEATLKAYLDDMTKLFFVKESQSVTEHLEVIGRAKTLTVLRQLDKDRKGLVIQFLSEARLIVGKAVTGKDPIISLATADLREANLSGTYLYAVALSGSDLSGAKLSGADLSFADLTQAILKGADLRGANLSQAKLSGTDLYGAELDETILKGAQYNTKEVQANVKGELIPIPATKWPQGFDLKAAGAREVNTLP